MTAFALSGTQTQAADPFPTATTGTAVDVGQTTATLTGWVDPVGIESTYIFYYGPTIDYGESTRTLGIGATAANVNLGVPIEGLQPDTLYHYRLFMRAIYGYGWASGEDSTFMTQKVPLGLQLEPTPEQVPYGRLTEVKGELTGTDDGYRPVVLQAEPFPYSAGFADVATQLTSASGGFGFTVGALPGGERSSANPSPPQRGLTHTTRFRVATMTKPSITSAIVTARVAVRVTAHVGRGRQRRARIYGTVMPRQRDARVEIVRMSSEGDRPVAWTTLRAHGATGSSFGREIDVHRGLYRVWVRVRNGPQVSWHSEPLLIR